MAYNSIGSMIFIETHLFTKRIVELMGDDEYWELQETLVKEPSLGKVIPGTGGLRKLRWRSQGRGKRGGLRIIYYWADMNNYLYMLFVYPKNLQENLTWAQRKQLRKIVENWNNG